jgi:hypothetical protein
MRRYSPEPFTNRFGVRCTGSMQENEAGDFVKIADVTLIARECLSQVKDARLRQQLQALAVIGVRGSPNKSTAKRKLK